MAREKKLPPPTPSEAAFERLLAEFPTTAPTAHDGGAPFDKLRVTTSEQGAQRHPDVVSAAAEPVEGCATPVASEAHVFLDELYAHAREFLERDPYATIGEASGFNTKVVGVSFEGRQDIVAGLAPGAALELRRQPDNPHDPNAIGVWYGALQLGFLKRPIAARVAPHVDAGERYSAHVTAVTGGGARSWGSTVYVTRERAAAPRADRSRSAVTRDDVLRALIGEQPLRI